MTTVNLLNYALKRGVSPSKVLLLQLKILSNAVTYVFKHCTNKFAIHSGR